MIGSTGSRDLLIGRQPLFTLYTFAVDFFLFFWFGRRSDWFSVHTRAYTPYTHTHTHTYTHRLFSFITIITISFFLEERNSIGPLLAKCPL